MSQFLNIENLSPLYEKVQTSGIFSDSKFFVDCTPLSTPTEILASYAENHDKEGFSLKRFVERHFLMPEDNTDTGYRTGEKSIYEHLDLLWNELTRQPLPQKNDTLIALPKPYIVPGGRFREIYYWDSYFTMLGLAVSNRFDLIENMIENFAFLIETIGFVPNGNRSYYLSRSQPPFFALMLSVLAEKEGDTVYLKYRSALEKEYAFWQNGAEKTSIGTAYRRVVHLPDGSLLNRYFDDAATPRPEAYIEDRHLAAASDTPPSVYQHIRAAAESGWDFSSRWFADGNNMATIETTDLIPTDLNCLLFYLEKTLKTVYELANETDLANDFSDKMTKRHLAIQKYCWNTAENTFTDYNHRTQTPKHLHTLAAVFPLFFNLATPEQATKIAEDIETNFLKRGGLRTTLVHSGQQWDAPNGWAPLQFMAYQGFKNYHFDDLAHKIAKNWLENGKKVFDETGKMMEKYDVEAENLIAGGGEYPNQDGFGWTNGVFLAFSQKENIWV